MDSNLLWKIYNTIVQFNNKQDKDIIVLYNFILTLCDMTGLEIKFVQDIVAILHDAIETEKYSRAKRKQVYSENRRISSKHKKVEQENRNLIELLKSLNQIIKDIKEPRIAAPVISCRAVIRKIRT
jgi:hypothetical protein